MGKIIVATLLALMSPSIVAVAADFGPLSVGVWLTDSDTANGQNAGTYSYVRCWANEYGYSSISHSYSKWINNDYFYAIQWASGYPDSSPAGSSASFGTDMESEALAEVYAFVGEIWVEDPGSYSHAIIDG